MIAIPVTRTHEVVAQRFRRTDDEPLAPWFAVGPVVGEEQRAGAAVLLGRLGLAVYRYPRKGHR